MRTLAFGDLAAGVWGAAWLSGDGAFVCLGALEARALPAARLDATDDEAGDWRLLDDRTALTASPAGAPVALTNADDAPGGFEQLCRVRGGFELDGIEHEVDCLGRRAVRTAQLDPKRVDSVRDISAWFDPNEVMAVVALRPSRARGHDTDIISAAVIDPEGSAAVADPRFSTTYGRAGTPIRSSFELWLGQAEDEYPRRAAGEAIGPRASQRSDGFDVQASLFRWHSRAREGAGVYILARPA
jgi:hypothetical protein